VLTVLGLSSSPEGYNAALQSVLFVSASTEPVEKNVSFVMLGKSYRQVGPVYSPLTKRMYEFIPSSQGSFASANATCYSRTVAGVSGGLASLLNYQHQLEMTTSLGTNVGWIGGRGLYSSYGSMWTWTDISASTKPFFVGDSTASSTAGYAYWATAQPRTVTSGNALYTLMQTDGTWTSQTDTSTYSSGFYCMYDVSGVTEPSTGAQRFGFTTVVPGGCISKGCTSTDPATCKADLACAWTSNTCGPSPCTLITDATTCNAASGCYYEPLRGQCVSTPEPPTVCTAITKPASCNAQSSCSWTSSGTCGQVGCPKLPNANACVNNAQCTWSTEQCIDRLCGSTTQAVCEQSATCQWNTTTMACSPSGCLAMKDSTSCGRAGGCSWNKQTQACEANPCPWSNSANCNADPNCLWDGETCGRSPCLLSGGTTTCPDPQCYTLAGLCLKSLCQHDNLVSCNNNTGCVWAPLATSANATMYCRPKTNDELMQLAAADDTGSCKEEEASHVALMVGLSVIVILMVVAYIWLRRRQDPGRAKSFNVAEQLRTAGSQEDLDAYEEMDDDDFEPEPVPHRALEEGLISNGSGGEQTRTRPSGMIGLGSGSGASGSSAPPVPTRAPRVLNNAPTSLNADEADVFMVDAPAASGGAGAGGSSGVPAGPVKKLVGVRDKKKPSAAPKRAKAAEADDPFGDVSYQRQQDADSDLENM